MAESMPQWKGLFDWSMQYHDGTTPTDMDRFTADPQKMQWLDGVLKNYMVDFSKRMVEIKDSLDATKADGSSSEQQIEQAKLLLEELLDIVESIDCARDLKSIGGLPALLRMVECSQPELQSRAADVLAACSQNNVSVQAWFYEEHVLEHVTTLLHSDEAVARRKGLLAASAMVRGYAPALEQFCVELKQLPVVIGLVSPGDSRTSVKALQLIKHVCLEAPSVRPSIATAQHLIDQLCLCLRSDDDQLVSSCLGLIHTLADSRECVSHIGKQEELVKAVKETGERLQALEGDDRDAMAEEIEWFGDIAKSAGWV